MRASTRRIRRLLAGGLIVMPLLASGQGPGPINYMGFAQGAVPVAVGGDAAQLNVAIDEALRAIDGDNGSFSLTRKPGGPDTEIFFVYKLAAPTTFTEFVVPNVLETPSPAQTFFREVEIAGSASGADGPFTRLAGATLATHKERDQRSRLRVSAGEPVRWVKLTLRGGIDVRRDKTFLEFSEISGYGTQEPVPLLEKFTGMWRGRGVLLELQQDGAVVTGCYDGSGDLTGTVSGSILRATGKTRRSAIPSTFVLTVADDGGITGVRSTNGAPFRLYAGSAAPPVRAKCSAPKKPPLGCGAIVHGIHFDYDSAAIRSESAAVLDAVFAALKAAPESSITIVGHTSSEGLAAYNQELSQKRAKSVVAALVERGISAARLRAKGAGEERPIAENTTDAGRSLNRRVEIVCS